MNFQTLWLYISTKNSRTGFKCLHISDRFNVQCRVQLQIPVILCSNLSSVQLQVKWTVTPDGLDQLIVVSCENIASWAYHLLLTFTTTSGLDIDCVLYWRTVFCACMEVDVCKQLLSTNSIRTMLSCYYWMDYYLCSTESTYQKSTACGQTRTSLLDLSMSWYHDWWRS